MELDNLLEKLKLDHLERQLDAVCEQAAQRQLNYKDFLVQALQTEWQGRFQRNTETRLKLARFPWITSSRCPSGRPWSSSTSSSNPAWIASRCGNWPE